MILHHQYDPKTFLAVLEYVYDGDFKTGESSCVNNVEVYLMAKRLNIELLQAQAMLKYRAYFTSRTCFMNDDSIDWEDLVKSFGMIWENIREANHQLKNNALKVAIKYRNTLAIRADFQNVMNTHGSLGQQLFQRTSMRGLYFNLRCKFCGSKVVCPGRRCTGNQDFFYFQGMNATDFVNDHGGKIYCFKEGCVHVNTIEMWKSGNTCAGCDGDGELVMGQLHRAVEHRNGEVVFEPDSDFYP